jgi:DNA-binding MarR family transcriptional regulator
MVSNKLILTEFLPYQLSVTSNAVSDLIARSYRGQFGLNIPEWRVLAILGERLFATQRELSVATAIDKVTVNRSTKALVDRGLLGRAPNETDGRSHHLLLTATGRELYNQIVPLAISIEHKLEEVLSPEEAGMVIGILGRLRTRAAEMENAFDQDDCQI